MGGLDRLRAKDHGRSDAPVDGEIVVEDGDVLTAVKGSYVSAQATQDALRNLHSTLDEDTRAALAELQLARQAFRKLPLEGKTQDWIY